MKTYLLPKFLSTLFVALILFPFSSCKKYEDGPAMSLRTKEARLENYWVMDRVLKNEADYTSTYLGFDSGLVLDLQSEKRFYWFFINPNVSGGANEMLTGSFSFWKDKKGITLSNLTTTQSRFCKSFTITKLTHKELWLTANFPGFEGYEFHFVNRTK